jgi:FkbM family methyltransferase
MRPEPVVIHDLANGGTLTVSGTGQDASLFEGVRRQGGHYEPGLMSFIGRCVSPGDVCLDIGANVGVMAIVLSRKASAGQVFAFEPGTETRQTLMGNLASASSTNVEVIPTGVWSDTANLVLNLPEGYGSGAFFATTTAAEHASESVPVQSIDDFVASRRLDRLDFIKIDAEGCEVAIFQGAVATMKRFAPTVTCELNPVALHRFQGADWRDLYRVMRSTCAHVSRLDEFGKTHPLRREADVAYALGQQGVMELVGSRRVVRQPWHQALRQRLSGLLRRSHRESMATFVIAPQGSATGSTRVDVSPGTTFSIDATVTNSSRQPWRCHHEIHPIRVGAQWKSPVHEPITEGRCELPAIVAPGEVVHSSLTMMAPHTPGTYDLEVGPVQEAFVWFGDLHAPLAYRVSVTVR